MISGDALPYVVWASSLAQRARARNGLPPSPVLAQILDAVQDAIDRSADVSDAGQADVREDANEQAGTQWLEVADVARRLGCSTRHARRLAERLGGIRQHGRWLIDEAALYEHQKGIA